MSGTEEQIKEIHSLLADHQGLLQNAHQRIEFLEHRATIASKMVHSLLEEMVRTPDKFYDADNEDETLDIFIASKGFKKKPTLINDVSGAEIEDRDFAEKMFGTPEPDEDDDFLN